MLVYDYMALARPEREERLEAMAPRDLLQLGVDLFNAGHHWHSHEAWEAAWIPSERPVRAFYQGLIQVAAALVHLARREYPGTVKLLDEGLAKLERYQPDYLAVDVESLYGAVCATREDVLAMGPRRLEGIDPGSLPLIAQQPLPQSRLAAVGAGRVHWLEWGASAAPPGARPPQTVVLMHAPGLVARVWQPIAARLADAYRVLAPDLPGHGLSAAMADTESDIELMRSWLESWAPGAAAIVSVGLTSGLAARAAPSAGAAEVCLAPRELTGPIDGDVPEPRRQAWPDRWEMFTRLSYPRWFGHWRSDLLWTYVEDSTALEPDGSVRLLCDEAAEQRLLRLGRPLDGVTEINVSPLAQPVKAAADLASALRGLASRL